MDKDRLALGKIIVPIAAVAVVVVVLLAAFYRPTTPEQDTLYQVSPFSVFSAGKFDGNTTFAELATFGDFGIGTLNGLDGEMFGVNGKFYQILTDGAPREIGFVEKTPYATVTFFDKDQLFQVSNVDNYSQLKSEIDLALPNHDMIYAIKVVGFFNFAETRSVPIQTKPYPTLTEALENQTIFMLNEIEGTAVGFFFPESMDGVDSVGYHLHFLTDDHTAGGHLLECDIQNASIETEQINDYHLLIT
jgi:acetolactate decarboxylase